jgi:hypothetical protein
MDGPMLLVLLPQEGMGEEDSLVFLLLVRDDDEGRGLTGEAA